MGRLTRTLVLESLVRSGAEPDRIRAEPDEVEGDLGAGLRGQEGPAGPVHHARARRAALGTAGRQGQGLIRREQPPDEPPVGNVSHTVGVRIDLHAFHGVRRD